MMSDDRDEKGREAVVMMVIMVIMVNSYCC